MIDFLVYTGVSLGILSIGVFIAALFITHEVGNGENDNDQ